MCRLLGASRGFLGAPSGLLGGLLGAPLVDLLVIWKASREPVGGRVALLGATILPNSPEGARLKPPLGSLGGSSGRLGALLERSWAVLGGSRAVMGPSLWLFEPFRKKPEAIIRRSAPGNNAITNLIRSFFRRPWAMRASLEAFLGVSWGHFWVSWGLPGFPGASGSLWGVFGLLRLACESAKTGRTSTKRHG